MRLRLFVVTMFLPMPDRTAGDRRFVALLELLARRHQVDLWLELDSSDLAPEEILKYRHKLKAAGVRLLGVGRAQFVRALARTHYDVGFFEFYYTANHDGSEFRRRQPGAKVIIDSVDVHFARQSAGAELGVVDAALADETRRSELSAYRTADAVVVVTDNDERILRAEREMPSLFIVPIVIPSHPRILKPRQPELLFVGNFVHPPNADGLRWFVKNIWPSVHEAVPDARLTVIGSDTSHEVREFGAIPGIQVLGFVDDTSSYLDRAAISIAPLRYGAGMKGKVVEAMSHGLPVVTTSVGAQGIDAISGQHLLIADNPADFAQALTILLNDPERCRQVGLAGQNHIARLCSPKRVELALTDMLKTLTSHRRSVKDWLRWRGFHARLAYGRFRTRLSGYAIARAFNDLSNGDFKSLRRKIARRVKS